MTKGRTKWYPRHVHPVRTGIYECAVQISRAVPLLIWKLEWDGVGFLTEMPLVVKKWRGLTRKEYLKTKAGESK